MHSVFVRTEKQKQLQECQELSKLIGSNLLVEQKLFNSYYTAEFLSVFLWPNFTLDKELRIYFLYTKTRLE